jgi:hypothetical protein
MKIKIEIQKGVNNMNKKKNNTTTKNSSIPFEFYCIAIGIIGEHDEFSERICIKPMLPDMLTFRRIEWDLKAANLIDEDGLPCFEDINQALNDLREYLANAPVDRFADSDKCEFEEDEEMDFDEDGFDEDDF